MKICSRGFTGWAFAVFLLFSVGTADAGPNQDSMHLSATPTSLGFGGTAVGTTTSSQAATLSNSSNRKVRLKVKVSGPFLVTASTCGRFLDEASSCQVTVAFSPTAPGDFEGRLTFVHRHEGDEDKDSKGAEAGDLEGFGNGHSADEESPVVRLSGSAPLSGTIPVSRVINASDLPDLAPLPPGTPAAPTGDEEGRFLPSGPAQGFTFATASVRPTGDTARVGVSDPLMLNLGVSFPGLNFSDQGGVVCGTSSAPVPPDTQVGVGPSHVVEAVNLGFQVFDKSGNKILGPKSLYDFFGYSPITDCISDPVVRFDAQSARWFLSIMQFNFNGCTIGSLNLAVSDTSDPTGGFHIYTFTVQNKPDFPKIGISDDKVVVAADAFTPSLFGCAFVGTEFLILSKVGLTSSGGFAFDFYPPNQGGFKIAPAQALSPSTTLYMAAVPDTSGIAFALDVWSLNGVPGSGSGTTFPPVNHVTLGNSLLAPVSAAQEGTNSTVNTNDNGLLDAFLFNGFLWFSANDGCIPSGDSAKRSCLRFIQIDPATMTETQDFDFGNMDSYYYYPAARPDAKGDLIAVFSGSSSSQFPSLYVGVSQSPNFGNLQQPTLLHAGAQTYTQETTQGLRWGDYSGAAVDPADGSIWAAGEYASNDSAGNAIWGTLISQVTVSAAPALSVTVVDLTTGKPISSGETVANDDKFQVTVTSTNGVNCAGQWVVSALGAPGAPPAVLVQSVPFIIGPASGGNSATGSPLTANGIPNDWKISASCDGAEPGQFAEASLEFFVGTPGPTGSQPTLNITVKDLTTGNYILSGQTVKAGDVLAPGVSVNSVDCAGQLVTTALGAPGSPPSVIAGTYTAFIVGPAVGSNSFANGVFLASPLSSGANDFKISATCNGASRGQFGFSTFEFLVF